MGKIKGRVKKQSTNKNRESKTSERMNFIASEKVRKFCLFAAGRNGDYDSLQAQ